MQPDVGRFERRGMKTDIHLRITGGKITHPDHYTVKIDAFQFPYIILDNQKVILNSAESPRKLVQDYGQTEYQLEILKGKNTLQGLIDNPKLTVEVLKLKDLARMG
jgi:hypothetical protein